MEDSLNPVLLHQTQKKNPEPILRFYLRQNNLLSNPSTKLSCFDTFDFVMQEFDIHLEQQTVIAAKDFESKTSHMWANIFQPTNSNSNTGTTANNNEIMNTNTSPISHHYPSNSNLSTGLNHTTYNNISDKESQSAKANTVPSELLIGSGADILSANVSDDNKLYIDRFNIYPIKINFSFIVNSNQVYKKAAGNNTNS